MESSKKAPNPDCKYCGGSGYIPLGNAEPDGMPLILPCKCTNPNPDNNVPGVRDIV